MPVNIIINGTYKRSWSNYIDWAVDEYGIVNYNQSIRFSNDSNITNGEVVGDFNVYNNTELQIHYRNYPYCGIVYHTIR